MGARFVAVSARRKRASLLGSLALAGAFSCSVFPDEATLPATAGAASGAAAAAGGSSVLPQAGMAGAPSVQTNAGAGAGPDEAGAPSGGSGLGGAPTGAGGSLEPVAGAAGAGGGACTNPLTLSGDVPADTWIEAANPKATHGNDTWLSVVSGGQPRRALLQLVLPAVPAGAVVVRATLSLHLQSNADVDLAARQLTVHELAQEVQETRATWEKWSNGNNSWMTLGGDFGQVEAEASLPAGSSTAALSIDITTLVAGALAANVASLPLLVQESSAPPPGPADLAFTSSEGDASARPALSVEYCEP